jgi:LacI family transcriptional regulator
LGKKITIKDIAKMAAVSPSAVSIAVNGKQGVGEDTRRRILDIVQRVGYTPNVQARRLIQNKTDNIGIMYHQGNSPLNRMFYLDVISAAMGACEEAGYNLLFITMPGGPRPPIPQALQIGDVDGVITLGEFPDRMLLEIQSLGIPLLQIDHHSSISEVSSIEPDYRQGTVLAAEFLIRHGHSRIAYLGEERNSYRGMQTWEGFRSTLEQYNIVHNENYVAFCSRETAPQKCCPGISRILEQIPLPTAILCTSDIFAVGVYRFLKERYYDIPKDFSVVGINNILFSAYIDPPLTTVQFQTDRIGQMAVDTLLRSIPSKGAEASRVMFQGALVERQSVRNFI